ncbi:hypothetical protein BH11MYX3_BH11MYX3_21170 [soil metagenome]
MIWTLLGTLAIVAATIVAGLFADRRWGLLVRKEDLLLASGQRPLLASGIAGEAPATALTASIGEIERIRRKQRCPRCRIALDSAADDSITHEDAELRVLQFTCSRCGGARSVYVREVT